MLASYIGKKFISCRIPCFHKKTSFICRQVNFIKLFHHYANITIVDTIMLLNSYLNVIAEGKLNLFYYSNTGYRSINISLIIINLVISHIKFQKVSLFFKNVRGVNCKKYNLKILKIRLNFYFQGSKKVCPQCSMITSPTDLRRIFM